MIPTFAAALLLAAAPPAPPAHRCAADAIERATPLLTLHFSDGQPTAIENLSIDDTVKVLPPLRALRGKGQFDVLEVWGFIYKGQYRMRFIYARIPGSCVLMGQEILEAADPY